MNNIKISIKIDFKTAIDVTDSRSKIEVARKIFEDLLSKHGVNTDMQVVQFPISSDMPEDVPFYVLKSKDDSSQLLYSRGYIQSLITAPLSKAGLCATQQMEDLVNALGHKDAIRSITNTFTKINTFSDFEAMKTFMTNTEYKDFDKINQLGFIFSYFKDSELIRATGESVSYASVVDLQTSTRGVQTELRILLGGVSIESGSTLNLATEQIDNYMQDMSLNNIDTLIGQTYGLAESE